jgi:diguanylate cyclase
VSILVWYIVLFAPQLAIGAGIGWWFAHSRAGAATPEAQPSETQASETQPSDEQPDGDSTATADELRLALNQLKSLTDAVQEDVREHAEIVDSSNKELAAMDSGDASEVMNAIGPIVKANEELQQRLQETEDKLAEQAELLDQQTTEARTDPLTGLLNRRGMEGEISKLLDEYEQSEMSFCYTILDIDHFKKFNDDHGHDVGDVVLSDVARVVSGAVSRQDIVARYGGEEFVILSPDTELHEAGQLLERVRAAVEANAVRSDAGDLKVTISLGVAQVGAEDSAALAKRADTALYAAKEAGRNRAFFHDGLHNHPISLGASAGNDSRSDKLTELPSRAVAYPRSLYHPQ